MCSGRKINEYETPSLEPIVIFIWRTRVGGLCNVTIYYLTKLDCNKFDFAANAISKIGTPTENKIKRIEMTMILELNRKSIFCYVQSALIFSNFIESTF